MHIPRSSKEKPMLPKRSLLPRTPFVWVPPMLMPTNDDPSHVLHCPRCGGHGRRAHWVAHPDDELFVPWYTWVPCARCQGTGRVVAQLDAKKEIAPCQ